MTAPPSGEFVRTHPLAIAATGADRLRQMILPLIAAAFALSTRDNWPTWAIAPAAAAFLIIPLIAAALNWAFLRYRTGAQDIRVESGVISREARSIPYERIQDVSIGETVVSRLLGLVTVKFETGAGGKDEIALSYVTREEGERLRELVRERRGEADAADEVEPVAEPAPIFAMSLPRVLEFGFYEFSLVLFAVLFAALGQLDFLLPFNIWDNALWTALLEEQGERVRSLDRAAQVASFLLAVIGLFIVGVLTGVGRTLLREYGFRLDHTAMGFRRRRGLLTRSDVVMPVHRVQAALITSGFVRKRIGGWHGLKFVSLATDGAKSSNHAMAPFATMEEVETIARRAGIALPDGSEEWQDSAARFWFDRAALFALPLTFVIAILMLAGQQALAAVLLLVGGFVVLRHAVRYRHYRYALAHGELMIRGGLMKPRLQAAPQIKLHSVEIQQGPVACWRGYATLNLGLAGGPLQVVGLPTEAARATAQTLLRSILKVDFSDLPTTQLST